MRYPILAIIGCLFLAACGGGDTAEDLASLKAQESEIKSEISALQESLKELQEEIAELDTTEENVNIELITVIDVQASEFKHFIEAQGKSYAANNVMVTTDMGGLVTAVYVDEGQYVSKGKTLIQLDNTIIQNQIAELNTSLGLAKDVYEKRKRLWDQNIGSEIEFLQAKNNYESLQSKLATANSQSYKSSIKAPISGYVDNISLQVGEMANPGMPAVQVINTSEMEIHVDLPEIYLGKVKRADMIEVELPALGLTKSAKVKSVSQSISPNNRTFKVIATVENKDASIKPNLLAKIKIQDEFIKEAITIPTSLLQESSNSYFVFVAEEDSLGNMVARRVAVEIGSSYGSDVVITNGIEIEDQVIDAGYRDVREGKLVEIVEK